MKEHTIEEKAKAYDKALSVAQETYTTQPTYKDWLAKMFPELKENEDELKWLTKFIEEEARCLSMDIRDDEDRIKLKNLQKSLAWLEKQGDNPTLINIDKMVMEYSQTKDSDFGLPVNCMIRAYRKGIIDVLNLSSGIEKQGEYKSPKEVLKIRQELYQSGYNDGYKHGCEDSKKQDEQILANSTKTCNDEQKTVEWHREDEQNLNTCLSYIPDEYLRRWLMDIVHVKYDKPADNVEPKFHKGEWIVWQNKLYKVNDNGCGYELIDQKGLRTSLEYGTIDENAHLWDITTDAKDGDVLTCYSDIKGQPIEQTGIIKQYVGRHGGCSNSFKAHFGIDWDNNVVIEGYMGSSNIYPSTKEQRDLLFQKMRGAGYEWDVERKQLKKIEQEPTELAKGEDYGIDGLWHAQRILEKTFGKVDGYQTDDGILSHECAISAVKELYEQKPAWSEEDEEMLDNIIDDYDDADEHNLVDDIGKVMWLKSIKDRVQSQPKQKWNEEDDMMIDETLYFLREYQQSDRCKDENDMQNSVTCENWLKSLKDRVGCEANCTTKKEWKPTKEQMDALVFVVQHYTPKVTDRLAWDSIKTLELMYYEIKQKTIKL